MSALPRKYAITHKTHYEYSSPSSLCHNQSHLRPRELPYQRVLKSDLEISPTPNAKQEWTDSFGNPTEFFSIEHLHPNLTITARSVVERSDPDYLSIPALTWIEVEDILKSPNSAEARSAVEFLFDSKQCRRSSDFHDFALDIRIEKRSFLECVRLLMSKIFHQFEYSPESTLVTTAPEEALRRRQGVCQDFAHIAIGCLRSLGIPARYVSGYLLTRPAPGKEKLIGADASHAWFSVYGGPMGWIDFDPTNNILPKVEHITVAWGRDYSDVAPIQGVFIGGGYTTLTVSVDVAPSEGNDSNTEHESK
jgi:transglutaminase-like putative cysteine protease